MRDETGKFWTSTYAHVCMTSRACVWSSRYHTCHDDKWTNTVHQSGTSCCSPVACSLVASFRNAESISSVHVCVDAMHGQRDTEMRAASCHALYMYVCCDAVSVCCFDTRYRAYACCLPSIVCCVDGCWIRFCTNAVADARIRGSLRRLWRT